MPPAAIVNTFVSPVTSFLVRTTSVFPHFVNCTGLSSPAASVSLLLVLESCMLLSFNSVFVFEAEVP